MGPISTGLGEVYMWTVEYRATRRNAPVRDGKPGWQSDGSYLTPEGERLTDDFERTVYLRTVQDWIIRPQIKTRARRGRRRRHRRLRQAVPGAARSREADRVRADLQQIVAGHRSQQRQPRRQLHRAATAKATSSAPAAASKIIDEIGADRRRNARRRAGPRHRTWPTSRSGGELRTGSASANGREVVVGTAPDADRRQQPHRRGGGRCQDQGDQPHAAARHPGANGARTARSWSTRPSGRSRQTWPKARCWSSPCCSCCSATSAPR